MRLKYQLRGLGIGIIITAALLMGFSDKGAAAGKTDDTIAMASTEDETTQEAVWQTIPEVSTQDKIEDSMEDNIEETQEAVTQEEPVSEEETASDVETENASEHEQTSENVIEDVIEDNKSEEMQSEEIESKESESETEHTDTVIIKIVSGDDSGTVARKLQVAGLIENASEYDAYLMQHGFDKKISVGTVEIEKGSTWLEIAQKLSERK